MKSKTYNGEVRNSEKDFETLQLGAFATPGLLFAQRPIGLTAESGFIPTLTPERFIGGLPSWFLWIPDESTQE
jgi:hypothetical protein